MQSYFKRKYFFWGLCAFFSFFALKLNADDRIMASHVEDAQILKLLGRGQESGRYEELFNKLKTEKSLAQGDSLSVVLDRDGENLYDKKTIELVRSQRSTKLDPKSSVVLSSYSKKICVPVTGSDECILQINEYKKLRDDFSKLIKSFDRCVEKSGQNCVTEKKLSLNDLKVKAPQLVKENYTLVTLKGTQKLNLKSMRLLHEDDSKGDTTARISFDKKIPSEGIVYLSIADEAAPQLLPTSPLSKLKQSSVFDNKKTVAFELKDGLFLVTTQDHSRSGFYLVWNNIEQKINYLNVRYDNPDSSLKYDKNYLLKFAQETLALQLQSDAKDYFMLSFYDPMSKQLITHRTELEPEIYPDSQ